MIEDSTFVIKCGRYYCRFGSYHTVTLCNAPMKATLYAREPDAIKRASEDHYGKFEKIASRHLRVVKLKVTVEEISRMEWT